MACDFLGDVSEPCRGLPEREPPLWAPGDLNQFFEEVVDNAEGKGDYYKQFKPKALSRPAKRSDGTTVPSVQKDGPWVVLLEDFLTSKEAERLVQIGHNQGYEGSLRAITPGQGEVTDGRTSENTWCTQPSCMEDPLVAKVLKRIAKTTKSTPNHREHLQMLRYDLETFYDQHHDFIPYQLDLPCGPRIMTLFLYLNDVEEGGNTGFPSLGISVKPKKGTALLWSSVKDKDPLERDPRMEHEAEKVLKGVKYGANAWIHNEDFQTPFALNCM
jgi:prolyl 4-hydroxylase